VDLIRAQQGKTMRRNVATKLQSEEPQLEEWMTRPTVLVVAQTPGLVDTLLPVLGPSANVVVVSSFAAGKRQLVFQPRLLITELRLGEYNGLHLALRAQAHGVASVVLGAADPVLQRDAIALGATYLTMDEPIAERIEALLHAATLQPRVPATDVAWGVYSGQAQPSGTAVWQAVLAPRATSSYH
jgi:hypothetical protein